MERVADVATRVKVRDPGYGATAKMVLACAMTMLEEREKMPKGGVLTPGGAFAATSLLDRLSDTSALSFETLSSTTS